MGDIEYYKLRERVTLREIPEDVRIAIAEADALILKLEDILNRINLRRFEMNNGKIK